MAKWLSDKSLPPNNFTTRQACGSTQLGALFQKRQFKHLDAQHFKLLSVHYNNFYYRYAIMSEKVECSVLREGTRKS